MSPTLRLDSSHARRDRLADLGQMASQMAHELKNALIPVAMQLDHLRSAIEDNAEGLAVLDKLESGFAAVDAAASDLLFFTADRRVSRQHLHLREIVREVCERITDQPGLTSISIRLDVSPSHTLMADRDLLRTAVTNLVRHAVGAMPQGGDLVITSYDGPDALELEIADSGPTLEPEARRRIFEPFGAAKDLQSGLGLAVVRHIALDHGGSASALTCPEGGTAYTLRFPHGAAARGRQAA